MRSSTPIDSEGQRYIEEFEQRLAQSGQFYKEAIKVLAVDRLQRDLEAMHAPPKPRKPLLSHVADVGMSAGRWVVRRFSPTRPDPTSTASTVRIAEDPNIIEGSYVVLSDTVGPGDDTTNFGNNGNIHTIHTSKEDQR